MQQHQRTFFNARPELKAIVLVLKDANIAEWHDLGLQLGLPSSTLNTILAAHPNTDDHGRMMLSLSEWLETDPDASWEKLAAAMATIGQKAIASTIRRMTLEQSRAQNLMHIKQLQEQIRAQGGSQYPAGAAGPMMANHPLPNYQTPMMNPAAAGGMPPGAPGGMMATHDMTQQMLLQVSGPIQPPPSTSIPSQGAHQGQFTLNQGMHRAPNTMMMRTGQGAVGRGMIGGAGGGATAGGMQPQMGRMMPQQPGGGMTGISARMRLGLKISCMYSSSSSK